MYLLHCRQCEKAFAPEPENKQCPNCGREDLNDVDL